MARKHHSIWDEDDFRVAGNLLYRGTPKADTFHGKGGNDTISGANGNDKLYGNKGNDGIYGQNDNDKLFGEAGNDTLDGGKGNDELKGGGDADTFIFKTHYAKDTILDFQVGDMFTHDTIDLSGLKAVEDYEDLVANHMKQVAGNVVIDGGHGDKLVLKGIDIDDLHDYHFLIF